MLLPRRLQYLKFFPLWLGPWKSSASLAVHPQLFCLTSGCTSSNRQRGRCTATKSLFICDFTGTSSAHLKPHYWGCVRVSGCNAASVFSGEKRTGIAKMRTLKQGAAQNCSPILDLVTHLTKRTTVERPAPVLGLLLFSVSLMCWMLELRMHSLQLQTKFSWEEPQMYWRLNLEF